MKLENVSEAARLAAQREKVVNAATEMMAAKDYCVISDLVPGGDAVWLAVDGSSNHELFADIGRAVARHYARHISEIDDKLRALGVEPSRVEFLSLETEAA